MPSTVADYLSELTLRLEARLGRRLAGAWLVGSGALGDFDATRSDVDVQAVATTRLARPELEALVAALSHSALRCPVRGPEFVLYARGDLSDRRGPAFQLNLNTGPRMEHHVGSDPDAEARFWFVLDTVVAHRAVAPAVAAARALRAARRARLVSPLRRRRGGARGLPSMGLGDEGALAVERRRRGMGRRPAPGPGTGHQGACPTRRPGDAGSHTQRG